jgi:hypothetical protein
VRRFRNIWFALAAFLWLPASVHCQIESLSGFELLQCHVASASQDANDHGCDENDCCLVEQTDYCPGTSRVVNLFPVALWSVFFLPMEIAASSPAVALSNPVTSPPFLIKSWPFLSRTALPVRAPSSVS